MAFGLPDFDARIASGVCREKMYLEIVIIYAFAELLPHSFSSVTHGVYINLRSLMRESY